MTAIDDEALARLRSLIAEVSIVSDGDYLERVTNGHRIAYDCAAFIREHGGDLADIAEAATWIAVSDRPPNATGIFIVYDTICGHARLFDFDAESSQASFMQSHGFTHWKPLPSPPGSIGGER